MIVKNTYVTARVADVAPVSPPKNHVETVDCDASCIIVLVENSLELHVNEGRAFLEANTAWGIKGSSLKLWDRVRSTGALLQMCLAESRWESTCRPRGRIGTVKAKRVGVVTIDIHLPDAGPGGVVPGWSGIVADQWDHDPSIVKLVLNILHIFAIWENHACAGFGLSIFVFHLWFLLETKNKFTIFAKPHSPERGLRDRRW